ncbi:hypothetical protein ACGFNV_02690 [Streptomyces sp. NPDC048751]|uniref:hypothetical protein n=1 Tax=Streptomyces sp. NPDC048751 TaxID=3365591 RepID=UPI003710D486
MSEIRYVRGDATAPSVKGVKVIAHVCNDIEGWGKGFVVALSRPADEALALEASVHMPRIGCGLAGGKWSRVEPLIAERLVKRGAAVTVYDQGEKRS